MIMPSKYLREDEALVGISAALLPLVQKNDNLTALWESAKKIDTIGSFERFILALDFLYLLGLVDLHNDKIVRVQE
ncbi:ABC-three component system middle component 6 [Pseudidiomarina sp.]|uniref:ABC-three component system middle component 6 n=1 Tax=Pseudidiomarina sp. TaxID=2081707 RepID=UPI003A9743BD